MRKIVTLCLGSVVALSASLAAQAQTLKPGLWEISNKMQSSSGELEKSMAQAQAQLAALPPDQRKMVEQMMAKQGVGMSSAGGATARVCMSREMVERNELPAQQGDCRQSVSQRTGNSMKISFTCSSPPSSGEGTVTFVSPEAYTMKMAVNTTRQGKAETMNMDASGQWLGSDCGSLKPLMPPKR
jgi:hypothetical protein